jgi:hypothetical protein
MSDWRPIEFAPKDQRRILGANEHSGMVFVTWRSAIGSADYSLTRSITTWRPTHFQPCPDPPPKPVEALK